MRAILVLALVFAALGADVSNVLFVDDACGGGCRAGVSQPLCSERNCFTEVFDVPFSTSDAEQVDQFNDGLWYTLPNNTAESVWQRTVLLEASSSPFSPSAVCGSNAPDDGSMLLFDRSRRLRSSDREVRVAARMQDGAAAGAIGVVFAHLSLTSQFVLHWQSDGCLTVWKRSGGSFERLVRLERAALQRGAWHAIVVVIDDDFCQISIDGGVIGRFRDAALGDADTGRVGLYCDGAPKCEFGYVHAFDATTRVPNCAGCPTAVPGQSTFCRCCANVCVLDDGAFDGRKCFENDGFCSFEPGGECMETANFLTGPYCSPLAAPPAAAPTPRPTPFPAAAPTPRPTTTPRPVESPTPRPTTATGPPTTPPVFQPVQWPTSPPPPTTAGATTTTTTTTTMAPTMTQSVPTGEDDDVLGDDDEVCFETAAVAEARCADVCGGANNVRKCPVCYAEPVVCCQVPPLDEGVECIRQT